MVDYPKIDKPTAPGWYWFRYFARDPWAPVWVARPKGARSLHARCYGETQRVANMKGGDWRGPIPEPTP